MLSLLLHDLSKTGIESFVSNFLKIFQVIFLNHLNSYLTWDRAQYIKNMFSNDDMSMFTLICV